ncbi:MAG: hypothetical protein FWC90_07115 [Oscillospiraceae bacterium]|nr:hypothetical protein [Oscillospiraceae bacterium]
MGDKAKLIRRAIFGLIVLILLVFNVPIRVNRTVTALEVRLNDPYFAEERTVEIVGWWRINIFHRSGWNLIWGHHRFSGRFEILGYPETVELEQPINMWPLVSRRPAGPMHYCETTRQGYRERSFMIYTGFLFRRAVITVADLQWVEDGYGGASGFGVHDRFIVLNTTSREEAVEILRAADLFGIP